MLPRVEIREIQPTSMSLVEKMVEKRLKCRCHDRIFASAGVAVGSEGFLLLDQEQFPRD